METRKSTVNQKKKECELLMKNDKLQIEKEYLTKKAINKSFVTRLHQERNEAETEAACANAKVSQGWRVEEVKQEDKLAREMVKDKYHWSKDSKYRDILRNSEEIRELQQKLKCAYLSKDVAIQLAEKNTQKLRVKSQEKDELKMLIEQEKHLQDIDLKIQISEEQKKLKYKEDLQDQIIDQQKRREEFYRNLLEEKTFIDESIRTMCEENKKDRELQEMRKRITKEDADSFIAAKQLWIGKETNLQEEEDRKIKEYLEYKKKKEKELQEANKKKAEMRLKNRLVCVNMIRSSEQERLEQDRITQILLDEDVRMKEEEKLRQDSEIKCRNMYELKEIAIKQMENRLKILEEDKLEEMKFCKQLLKENNEAIQRDQEESNKRRLQSIEYGRSLKFVMEQQRMNKLKNMEDEYLQHQSELEEIQKRRTIIDEERIKLLKEHVGNLLGFLPKGVIRKEDLPLLDPEVRKFFENPSVYGAKE